MPSISHLKVSLEDKTKFLAKISYSENRIAIPGKFNAKIAFTFGYPYTSKYS